MAIQRIIVDLIPGAKDAPVINASQYDTGRQFEIELLNGGEAYTPSVDMTIELHVKKRDDTIIVNSPINRTNNIITFSTTEQMTACHGTNVCEVSISDDSLLIGTANFILEVEKDPIEGGLTSESEIDNLTQQIADIVPTVIGNDYYNKTQTDALLANKANVSDLPDMTDYYTKTQTDNLLYDKVDYSELSNYYKKSEVDTLLNAKVDTTTLQADYYDADYISTQFARKSFVENYVDATATASGNPCSFDTAKYHTLIPALTANIVCGGGGGTPSTPIPLVPHSELNLTRCGKNLHDLTPYNAYTNIVTFGQTRPNWEESALFFPIGTYTFSLKRNEPDAVLFFGDRNGAIAQTYTQGATSLTFNVTEAGYYSLWLWKSGIDINDYSEPQVQVGSTATAYAPYNGQPFTVAFGQTVYGGVYDKSGRLTITHGMHTFDGSENWDNCPPDWPTYGHCFTSPFSGSSITLCDRYDKNINAYSDNNGIIIPWSGVVAISDNRFSSPSDFRAEVAINNIHVVYPLATPIVIDVPSISVFAENGVNNITSDCGGDVNVSYKDTIQHYIDSRI